ncbi:hypothetical protein D3C86_1661450 [compost metagenome]
MLSRAADEDDEAALGASRRYSRAVWLSSAHRALRSADGDDERMRKGTLPWLDMKLPELIFLPRVARGGMRPIVGVPVARA